MKQRKAGMLAVAMMVLLASFYDRVQGQPVVGENAGLKLPPAFHAVALANNLGRTRHLIVTPQNEIYVHLARPAKGKSILLLHQEGDSASVVSSFANYGGTGIFLRDGYLYAASNSEVFRYKVDAQNHVIDTAAPERIITGLVDKGTHETKSLTMDAEGNLYVPIGCPSNSCQEQDRQKGSMGMKGCPLLETSGGVWRFKTDKLNQTYADGVRYATGLRNVVAVDWNSQTNKLFVMQHGRDQLNTIFPDMYNAQDNAELPAECMYALSQDANAGWPNIYYDNRQKKKMIAPEYGGDGKQSTTDYLDPAAAYPAHMAPNGLLFYTGTQFPAKYRNGAFIAFHGSWNRSPEPQAGYFVVFQPFKNGMPFGDWEVFADNFSGSPEKTASGRAEHRPCGLAQGPDGALYVTDDSRGTLYKISYVNEGQSTVTLAKAVKPGAVTPAVKSSALKKPTAVKKPSPDKNVASVAPKSAAPVKAVATSSPLTGDLAAGKKVYTLTCATCHQADGGGVQNINPSLIKSPFVSGSKEALIRIILNGMKGKEINGEPYSGVMPPFAYLSDKDIANVLTFVRASFKNKAGAITPAEVKNAREKK